MMSKIQFLILLPFLFVLVACSNGEKKNQISDKMLEEPTCSLWQKIREEGKILVFTEDNSTDHFIYRGCPMGFQYELLQKLSESLNLELELILSPDLVEGFSLLDEEDVHLMAMNLTVTQSRRKKVDFTTPLMQTRQVLVQRKPEGWESMNSKVMDRYLIKRTLDLAKREIFVRSNSSFTDRVNHISEEIGDSIFLKQMSGYTDEELIQLVASGEIDFTVCDESIAKVNASYFPNIDVNTPLSFEQNIAWAVPKGADSLRHYLNQFIEASIHERWYKRLYNKYYKNSRSVEKYNSNFMSVNSSQISEYDEIIKEKVKVVGWDWRLVSSVIYQESRFNHDAISWSGAFGLMQLMPNTASLFKVDKNSSPSENIRGGVELLALLDSRLQKHVQDSIERVKFVLAAYNIGLGHVMDAIRLAKAYDKDPTVWKDNVAYFLQHKTNPKYYNHPVVKHGYCRGTLVCDYVTQVLQRYRVYVMLIK